MMILDRVGNKKHLTEEEMFFQDSLGYFGRVYQSDMDFVGLENLFYSLPKDQTEIMVSLFLGLKPKEIVKIHRFRNIGRFYSTSARLRESYRRKKERYLSI